MKLFSMFSGIGGFDLAFKRIFPDGEIVGYSEIDKYAIQVYKKHFKGVKNYGNIEQISESELPDFNICTFGFPCQDVSVAGKRKGFEGRRSSLFHEAIRIIGAKRPDYIIFENVKGLFSSNGGKDFTIVLQEIAKIGYDGQWQLLNSKFFGVPQNRERIFFVGHIRNKRRPEIFPIGQPNKSINGSVKEPELNQIGNVDTKGHNSIWGRVYDANGIATTLNANGGGMGAKTGLYAVPNIIQKSPEWRSEKTLRQYTETCPTLRANMGDNMPMVTARPVQLGHSPEAWASKSGTNIGEEGRDAYTLRAHQPNGVMIIPVLTPDRIHKRQNGRRFKENGEPAFTLTAQDRNGIFNGSTIRKLTPLECERLQGFPDNWTQYGIDEKGKEVVISDSQRYKCCGNAITVNVAEEIFLNLRNSI